MSETKKTIERPLSPHLQVYRLPMTALMSITHRATGFILAVGTLFVTWMLLAVASGPVAYDFFHSYATSLFGKFLLIGWSVALFYHLANGIRHLVWDMGYLFKQENAYKAGYAVLGFTLLATALFWMAVCGS